MFMVQRKYGNIFRRTYTVSADKNSDPHIVFNRMVRALLYRGTRTQELPALQSYTAMLSLLNSCINKTFSCVENVLLDLCLYSLIKSNCFLYLDKNFFKLFSVLGIHFR